MTTASALMSIEQYLHTSYSPDMDFVDGELQERNLGEFEHSRLQWLIALFVGAHEAEWKITGVIEQRIRVSVGRVRICDLALLRADAPREKVTQTPPLVCIEIMSPEDRTPRAKLVLADYLTMGVNNIWLIDPMRRSVSTYGASGLIEVADGILRVSGTPIQIEIGPLFDRLD